MCTWYAIGDRKKLISWLSNKQLQADPECHVLKKITPSNEAWAVNQYDGLCQKFKKSSDMKDPSINKKSLGKWTSFKRYQLKKGQGRRPVGVL